MASKKKTIMQKVSATVINWMVEMQELPISDCDKLRKLADAINAILLTDCPVAIVTKPAKKKARKK